MATGSKGRTPALVGLALLGCAAPAAQRYEFARPAMGTEFRIVLLASDPERARSAAEAAFARIHALERCLSDYDPESELSRLSAASGEAPSGGAVPAGAGSVDEGWQPVSADLWAVLARATELAQESEGAFDVTVGPLTRLWRRARRRGELPDPVRLAEARRAVGFRALELDPERRRVRLRLRGMRLDPGGIGKGYALDGALETLRAAGIERALVVGGGEMVAGAPPPGESGWRVELVGLDPAAAEGLELARAALATSGDLSQFLERDGTRYSHILDPRTGEALTEQRLVSVLGPSATWTDALATTLSVLGPEAGFALLARHPGYEARMLVRRDDRIEVRRSPGFPEGLSCADPSPPSAP